TPEEAVADATVVVTATTSEKPVFPAEALAPGTVVIGVGAYSAAQQEIPAGALHRAAKVFGDVPSEVAGIGDVVEAGLSPEEIVPFADVFSGQAGRSSGEEILIMESVGSAVLDAAAGGYILEAARAADVGTIVDLE
ncbi:MAG: ornithine cyclodeaminase family protein, partial [Halobacteriales archaeon]|nr:ornithine cyclodeaminase family protein [Halobacteriales archaeon]